MVAEKQTLLSKLHSFEKKEENIEKKDQAVAEQKKIRVIEPPKPPPKKVEVCDLLSLLQVLQYQDWGTIECTTSDL